jgi:hypothetical protein
MASKASTTAPMTAAVAQAAPFHRDPAAAAAWPEAEEAGRGDGGADETAGLGTVQDSVRTAAPFRPATTTAVTRVLGVLASDSSSPISKKPGPEGAGVRRVSRLADTAEPWLAMLTSAQA